MEKHLFIYSRTRRFDYRLIYTPDSIFVPDDIRWKFIDFVREILNEDNVLNGDIVEPRWGIYKYGNYLLVGIGVRNSMLGDYDSDYTGTKIRGFYGQIFNDVNIEDILLSTSIDYYRNIFTNKIVPIFDSKNESEVNSIDSQYVPNIDLYLVKKSEFVQLNTNDNITRILPYQFGVKELISSTLYHNEVNIVTSLNDKRHAVDADICRFNNITVIGWNEQHDIVLQQTQQDSGNNSNGSREESIRTITPPREETGADGFTSMDRFVDKLISIIESISKKIGIPPISIVERLYKRFGSKDKNEFLDNENEELAAEQQPLQPMVFKKANRKKIDEIIKRYQEEKQTSSSDDDLSPIEFRNKQKNE